MEEKEKKEKKEAHTAAFVNKENKSREPLSTPGIPATYKLNSDNPEQLIYESDQVVITLWGGIDLYNVKKLRATLHVQSKNNDYIARPMSTA